MKRSTITFDITLDNNNIPESIQWDATDKPERGATETKAIGIALWDHQEKNTLRIDLWAKDMPINEMKRFYVDCLGGLSQSVLTSTGDTFMATEMNALCEKLVEHLKKES